ncbi:hypothetical protein, partial [Pseudomonas syringae group genomosp. 7]|uniref:hypothetical protein n=1 Tax=Pseudomonas syringae group genomosp. 7 TaxID=251699 RepID=UPI00376F8D46
VCFVGVVVFWGGVVCVFCGCWVLVVFVVGFCGVDGGVVWAGWWGLCLCLRLCFWLLWVWWCGVWWGFLGCWWCCWWCGIGGVVWSGGFFWVCVCGVFFFFLFLLILGLGVGFAVYRFFFFCCPGRGPRPGAGQP